MHVSAICSDIAYRATRYWSKVPPLPVSLVLPLGRLVRSSLQLGACHSSALCGIYSCTSRRWTLPGHSSTGSTTGIKPRMNPCCDLVRQFCRSRLDLIVHLMIHFLYQMLAWDTFLTRHQMSHPTTRLTGKISTVLSSATTFCPNRLAAAESQIGSSSPWYISTGKSFGQAFHPAAESSAIPPFNISATPRVEPTCSQYGSLRQSRFEASLCERCCWDE
jgi:hypothetical protein